MQQTSKKPLQETNSLPEKKQMLGEHQRRGDRGWKKAQESEPLSACSEPLGGSLKGGGGGLAGSRGVAESACHSEEGGRTQQGLLDSRIQ